MNRLVAGRCRNHVLKLLGGKRTKSGLTWRTLPLRTGLVARCRRIDPSRITGDLVVKGAYHHAWANVDRIAPACWQLVPLIGPPYFASCWKGQLRDLACQASVFIRRGVVRVVQ